MEINTRFYIKFTEAGRLVNLQSDALALDLLHPGLGAILRHIVLVVL